MTSKQAYGSFTSSSAALQAIPYSLTPGESKNFDLSISSQNFTSSNLNDPPYLYNQLRSAEWLERYGLRSQKLTFDQILQQTGFKRIENFDPVIGKTVTSKYAGNLYHEVLHDNGDRYVLTCRPEKLREYHNRLMGMMNFLRKRLHFISSGSRRLFGIISEPSVCLICDCKTIDRRIFNQFQLALISLIKEQISKIKRVHIIWISNDNQEFAEKPTDVSSSSLDQIMDWIYDRKCPKTAISVSSTTEAIKRAFTTDVHAIYLLSEGDSSDSAREILRDTIVKTRLSLTNAIPVHVVSFCCHGNDTLNFLRSIAETGDGSFFSYKIKSEIADLRAPLNLNDPTRIQLQNNKLQFGTNASTPIPDFPPDMNLLFKEIHQCQMIIDRLEKILGFIRDENQSSIQSFQGNSLDAFQVSGDNNFQRSVILQSSNLFSSEEAEMSSADWLKTYGIDAQKLDFFSILNFAAFPHCDGVVKVLRPPAENEETTESTPANPEEKLINAKYCDQFAHVTWPDGTIRHVHVTPELHRDYERRLRSVLEKIKARMLWLKKGSRDVFGTILENNIYFLIDASKSMQHHLGFVKEKLRLLLQDQLPHKERVNFVAFNSNINPWRDRLTRVQDSSSTSQLQSWIEGLTADGTTNTLAAIRFALADSATEAIYLLTDGRPDQSERHILSQVQYRQTVPIHTIAFNCQDETANQFLFDLSKQTGGRFHTFTTTFNKSSSIELPESEDVGLLKKEYLRGEQELAKISALRDECIKRAWARDNQFHRTNKYLQRQSPENNVKLLMKNQNDFNGRVDETMDKFTKLNRRKKKKSAQIGKRRPQSANVLRSLNENQWLLPESREYLEKSKDEPLYKSDSDDRVKMKTKKPKQIEPQTPYDEVVAYLKKNSLIRRGLTIFDVLHPTMVTVKEPEEIQVIDRQVISKVWDDILPLAYGSHGGKLRLINHYAVNLVPYEKELTLMMKQYKEFVEIFIWKYLSENEKRKISVHLYWESLSSEEKKRFESEIENDEHNNQNDLEYFAWKKLRREEQDQLLGQVAPFKEPSKALLKQALKNDRNQSAFEGVEKMEVEINRAMKFLQISMDLRQLQTRFDKEKKGGKKESLNSGSNTGSQSRDIPKSELFRVRHAQIRQRVICWHEPDGYFRPGMIEINVHGRTVITFDTGTVVPIEGQTFYPTSGAIVSPSLSVNDTILVRQVYTNDEFWVPGVVAVLPDPKAGAPLLYTIKAFTPRPKMIDVYRSYIFRISTTVFQRTLAHINKVGRIIQSAPNDHAEKFFNRVRGKIEYDTRTLSDKLKKIDETNEKNYGELKRILLDHSKEIQKLQKKTQKVVVVKQEQQITTFPFERDPSRSPSPMIVSHEPTPLVSPVPESAPVLEKEISYCLCEDGFVRKGTIIRSEDSTEENEIELEQFENVRIPMKSISVSFPPNLVKIKEIKEKSFILIENPKDSNHNWIPAAVLKHIAEGTLVRYYDCEENSIKSDENVLSIENHIFKDIVENRLKTENEMATENLPIVAFHAKKKMFALGTMIGRAETNRFFRIRWADDAESVVEDKDLFGTFSLRVSFAKDQFVLTKDVNNFRFRLAKIIQDPQDDQTLLVKYTDEESSEETEVQTVSTFCITKGYHDEMLRQIKSRSN